MLSVFKNRSIFYYGSFSAMMVEEEVVVTMVEIKAVEVVEAGAAVAVAVVENKIRLGN